MFPTSNNNNNNIFQQHRSSSDNNNINNGIIPNGFPFPFLFRFPPPFGFGNIPPIIPPSAFASLLEARMKQIQSIEAINDKSVVSTTLSGIEKSRKNGILQRPTKQINFQLINGKNPNEPINVLLRHTENVQGNYKYLFLKKGKYFMWAKI
uniref:Uncharacterized protein n=1 Tax=Panagrolaimus davidi TaxID=227884 RepID=A0A914PIZ5_9BILA